MKNKYNNIFQKFIENLNQNQKLHQKYLQKYYENNVINEIYEFYKISFEIFQKSHFTHSHDVNNIKKMRHFNFINISWCFKCEFCFSNNA